MIVSVLKKISDKTESTDERIKLKNGTFYTKLLKDKISGNIKYLIESESGLIVGQFVETSKGEIENGEIVDYKLFDKSKKEILNIIENEKLIKKYPNWGPFLSMEISNRVD